MTAKSFIAQANRLLRKWRMVLGLGAWDIKFHYHLEVPEEHSHTGAVAWTVTSWPYRLVDANFIVPRLMIQNEKRIEEILVHEMVHILVAELQASADKDDAVDHVERVVTDLTNAIIWTRDAAKKGRI